MEAISEEIRSRLKEAVTTSGAEGILFSGGLDTSILALLTPGIPALNIKLAGYGEDSHYAELLAKRLSLKLHVERVNVEDALETIPRVIKMLNSFDPALPNDLAIFFALKKASEEGLTSVITGDGADELFAGYSYMFDLDLSKYLPELCSRMRFSAGILGSHLGIKVIQPFLDESLVNFALSISPSLKIRDENGQKYGKWILRHAFAGYLPPEIIWQSKRPIETGSGFTELHGIIGAGISDADFARAKSSYGVDFLSKDHLFYYRIYREVVGEIPLPKAGEIACPGCGAGILTSSYHCRTCGWSRKLR